MSITFCPSIMKSLLFVVALLSLLVVGACTTTNNTTPLVYHYPAQFSGTSGASVPASHQASTSQDQSQKPPPTPQQTLVSRTSTEQSPVEATLEVDEFNAYPSNIEVTAHDKVRLHFKARSMHVSHGVVVRSAYFTTHRLLANEEDTVEFIAPNDDFTRPDEVALERFARRFN